MIAPNLPHNDDPKEPKLLTVRSLAKCLAVSVRTAHRMNREGLIPAPLRIGRSVRWREDEISAWLPCGGPRRDVWEQRQATTMDDKERATP